MAVDATTRIGRLAALLPDGVDGALITSAVGRRYLTGMKSSAGVVLVTREAAYLLIDFRYYERACAEARDCEVVLLTELKRQLTELLSRHQVNRLAIESAAMTVFELAQYRDRLPGVTIVADNTLSDRLDTLRIRKDEGELASMRAAQHIAEEAFTHILEYIRPGRTEREVALELDYFMLKGGAEALSFDTIAVSGKNSSLPHGVPCDKPLEDGDFLTLDFGAVVEGYHSDMTRTVAIGHVSDDMRAVYDCVLTAQRTALSAVRAGITGKTLDAAARDVIKAAGYGEFFGHGLGHGVGLDIHESPSASPSGAVELKDGMVVTVEPGIYLPGRFGVRIEDMVVVREGGCENLTSAPKELLVIGAAR